MAALKVVFTLDPQHRFQALRNLVANASVWVAGGQLLDARKRPGELQTSFEPFIEEANFVELCEAWCVRAREVLLAASWPPNSGEFCPYNLCCWLAYLGMPKDDVRTLLRSLVIDRGIAPSIVFDYIKDGATTWMFDGPFSEVVPFDDDFISHLRGDVEFQSGFKQMLERMDKKKITTPLG